MKYEDDELKKILKPILSQSPNDLQIKQWQRAVLREARAGSNQVTLTKWSWGLQLVAASIVGMIIGLLSMMNHEGEISSKESITISYNNATFEHSHANLD